MSQERAAAERIFNHYRQGIEYECGKNQRDAVIYNIAALIASESGREPDMAKVIMAIAVAPWEEYDHADIRRGQFVQIIADNVKRALAAHPAPAPEKCVQCGEIFRRCCACGKADVDHSPASPESQTPAPPIEAWAKRIHALFRDFRGEAQVSMSRVADELREFLAAAPTPAAPTEKEK